MDVAWDFGELSRAAAHPSLFLKSDWLPMNTNRLQKVFFAAIVAISATASFAADGAPDPTDPEAERQRLKVPEGFEINLYAADPMVSKPIGMNFDADGRLWVVSSSIYPQIKPGDVPNDRVIVLE